jgi:hypothetical protein
MAWQDVRAPHDSCGVRPAPLNLRHTGSSFRCCDGDQSAHWDAVWREFHLTPAGCCGMPCRRHICCDYTAFHVDAREGGEMVLRAMRESVASAGVREVGLQRDGATLLWWCILPQVV